MLGTTRIGHICAPKVRAHSTHCVPETSRGAPAIISTTDLPLTEKGIKQAQAAQDYLEKLIYPDAYHKVFSSPLMRAKQTAAIICGPNMKISEINELREMNLGLLEGLTWDERNINYPGINIENALSGAVMPDGEKYQDVKLRCADFIQSNLVKKYKGKNILIVSHGITIRVLINVLLNKADYCVNYINWPDNTAITETEWSSRSNTWTLRRLNDRRHLKDANLESSDFETWGAFATADYDQILRHGCHLRR